MDEDGLKVAVATTAKHIWWARFVLYVLKPIEYVLAMAYFACLIYVGTWIVVLALKHSGAI